MEELKFIVETSARHIHISQKTLDYLQDVKDGEGKLNVRKELSQPGQFASDVKLDLVGPVNPKTGKPRVIAGVTILGPTRSADQVELSLTDARSLGVSAPIRESGDLAGSAPITLRNPLNGKEIEIKEGVIIAKRHIHMTPADAKAFGVENGEIVKVLVTGTGRETIFGDTIVRVSDKYALAMHIDTDEANGAACSGTIYGTIVK